MEGASISRMAKLMGIALLGLIGIISYSEEQTNVLDSIPETISSAPGIQTVSSQDSDAFRTIPRKTNAGSILPAPGRQHANPQDSASAKFFAFEDPAVVQARLDALAIHEFPDEQGVFVAHNSTHGFQSLFLKDGGVELSPLSGADWTGTMSHGESGATPKRIHDHRIEIDHPSGLTEWYENGERGLEHGFVVSAAAAANLRGTFLDRLVVPMTLHDLTAQDDPSSPGDLRFLDLNGQPVLGYRSLKIWDAQGAILEGEMQVTSEGFLLAVNDQKAVYPITIDPFLVTYTDEHAVGIFYRPTKAAISDNSLFVREIDVDGTPRMAYWRRDQAGLWSAASTPPSAINALGLDGDTLISGSGIHRRFENMGVSWVLEKDFNIGVREVAIHEDTALVSTLQETFVYQRSSGTWAVQQSLPVSGPVMIEDDTALIGNSVYFRSNGSWSLQGTLSEVPDPQWQALSGDTIILNTTVFVRNGGTWQVQAILPVAPSPIGLDGDRAIFLSRIVFSGLIIHTFERVGAIWQEGTPYEVPPHCDGNRCPRTPDADLTSYWLSLNGNEVILVGFHKAVAHWRGFTTLVLNDSNISIPPVRVLEGAGMAEVVVNLTEPAANEITIDYNTQPHSADETTDFTASSGTLTILQGESEGRVQFPLVDDEAVEEPEVLKVLFTNGSGISLPPELQTVITILDDDILSVGITGAAGTEGELIAATLRLNNTSDSTVRCRVSFSNGQSDAWSTFLPGQTEKSVLVDSTQDAFVEGPEVVTVRIEESEDAVITQATAVVTILDDDVTSLSIEDLTVDETVGSATITVSIPEIVANDLVILYQATAGTAEEDSDFGATSGSVILPRAGLNATFTVPIINDGEEEETETFTVTATVANTQFQGTGTITITDGGSGAPTYDDWVAEQGLDPALTLPTGDHNNDGFDNLLHYALGVSLDSLLPREHPNLFPQVDTAFLANRALYRFETHTSAIEGIVLAIEESSDGITWHELASKSENNQWAAKPGSFVLFFPPQNGFRPIAVASGEGLDAQPFAFFRFTARVANP